MGPTVSVLKPSLSEWQDQMTEMEKEAYYQANWQ